MSRLTERDNGGNAYFPECFKEPCLGSGCKRIVCEFLDTVCARLAEYEETGLKAEEIKARRKNSD